MAASTPPVATVGYKNTIRQKASKASFKQVLKAPFQVPWPFVNPDDNADFISRLTNTLTEHRAGNAFKRGGKEKGKRRRRAELISGTAPASEKPPTTSSSPSDLSAVDAVVESTEADRTRLSPYASEVVLGVNAVTRALEKPSAIRLVVVCRSIQPTSLTRHLAAMALQQNCPAVAIAGLSDALRPLLNVRSVAAMAFKSTDRQSVFDDIVSHIAARCPRLSRIPHSATQYDKASGSGTLSESHSRREEAVEAPCEQGVLPCVPADTAAIPASAVISSKGLSLENDSNLSPKPNDNVPERDPTSLDRCVPCATTSDFSHLYLNKSTANASLKRPLSSPSESVILRQHHVSSSVDAAVTALYGNAAHAVSSSVSEMTASVSSHVTYVKAKVSKMQCNPDRKHKNNKLKSK